MKETEIDNYNKKLHLAFEIFKRNNDAIVITDENAKIVDVNNAFVEITGYRKDEVIGKNPSILQSKWHDAEFYKELWKVIDEKGIWEGEIKDRRKNGELYISKAFIFKIEKDNNINYIGISKDITKNLEHQEQIMKLAFYDCLTDLPNRTFFEEHLKKLIIEGDRYDKKFALLFIDLDNFKYVNDTFGHLTGDKLLESVAKRLTDNIRESDVVARLAGDEFTIILKDIKKSDVIINIANKIISNIQQAYFIDGHEVTVGTSIGISIYPDDALSATELIKNADIAMYNSKKNGKNRFTFYSDDMNDAVVKRYQIENYMRESIKSDNFFIEYQPLVGTKSSLTLSYEALIRWTHPSLGILYPNDFIDLAEESGLIIKLGHWILDRVFKDIKIMKDKDRPFNVSINISAKQLNDSNFSKYVASKIKEYDIDTAFVEFEITESILLENNDYVRKNIMILRELGIRFSLDDFGTGYSSMNYIKNFPIDTIKIDRSFVDTMLHDKSNMAIVDSILYLSKQLGKSVIAEGIETIEQMQHFQEKECDILQGFYFSKPKKLDDL